ncbi:hypothetical protein IEU95_16030 [Hoyosella rhizosphaerae]|uniref:Uncharacterized protein n=1 Tax=Hoyosella rhizosphaerae TaxID=1755582 RepID=A0A916UJM6_9ACTN|nr:hypothetical protein [Hoyosella rhizosphaerae]MBN4928343.1 hypothetical protein [Hoyosella rhizosphaerae]GGC74219.1 hypothetical protein GCM10011410_29350 [Hoyosella rhizosphaerae]
MQTVAASEAVHSVDRLIRLIRSASVVLLAMVLLGGCASTQESAQPPIRIPDAATPISADTPIFVGGHRYLSPCRALPPEEVEAIFGTLSDTAVYEQRYLDESTSSQQVESYAGLSFPTRCEYRNVDGHGLSILVEIEQYLSVDFAKEFWLFMAKGMEKERDLIDKFGASITDSSDDPVESDAEKFVDNLRNTLTRLEDPTRIQPGDFDGSVAYVSGPLAFHGLKRNIRIEMTSLVDSAADTTHSDSDTSRSLASLLAAQKKLFEVIFDNIDNVELDQSALPTNISNETVVGGGHVLEPCRVLDNSAMAQVVTLQPAARLVSTTSVPKKLDEPLYGYRRGQETRFARNTCTRTSYAAGTGYEPVTTIRATIYYLAESELNRLAVLKQIQNIHYGKLFDRGPRDIDPTRLTRIPGSQAEVLYVHDNGRVIDIFLLVENYIVSLSSDQAFLADRARSIDNEKVIALADVIVDNITA